MVEKQLQIEASNGHQCPQNCPPSISIGEIQLFLHDYKSFNILTCLNSLAQLVRSNIPKFPSIPLKDNGSVVEIIRIDRHEKPTRPHSLLVNTYVTPTFCDYCGEILMGLVKQGLQCQLCKFDALKRQNPFCWVIQMQFSQEMRLRPEEQLCQGGGSADHVFGRRRPISH